MFECLKIRILLIVVVVFSSFTSTYEKEKYQHGPLRTIIIDPGHGYPDPGAEGKYSSEADLTLAIGLNLGEKLKKKFPNVRVLYTRTNRNLPNGLTNKDQANRWRAQFANDNKGDLYISIHVNDVATRFGKKVVGTRQEKYTTYVGKGKKRKKVTRTRTVNTYETYRLPCNLAGTQTYVWSANNNDQKKDYINTEMSKEYDSDISSVNDEETRIISSIYLKKYLNRSKALAELIEDEFRNKGIKSAGGAMQFTRGIRVLGATAMPSVLVETGFICNPEEEDYLNSLNGQNQIADGILQAITIYKGQVETGAIREGTLNQ